ncbi:BrnT family toxin [Cyanobacterium aponinum]|uniref:BrnT family toxin n=1 Tax=Cyanobacterium aponinum TaxID=379064 RepID=UPI000C12B715|nr:BrnT family toxin [Cyanobacterium aponinum]PHV61070.1 hypothetical protein CSQ80_17575 [Cyanobacterium aponinum IPPAS B-1201]
MKDNKFEWDESIVNTDFEWDSNKEEINRKKHNITFEQGCVIFNYPRVTFEDTRKDYGETRYIAIGRNNQDFILTVVYTIRDDRIRIISARTGNKKERIIYDNYYKKDE